MKFQDSSFNGLKVTAGTKSVTHPPTHAPKAICPINFFKVGGIKRGNTVFQIITLSVAMETCGRIWPNFELIQASMHVLIACKYEKDQMKNSGENVMMSFSPL